MNIVDKARDFAIKKHNGHLDDNGDDYAMSHLFVVVDIMLGVDRADDNLRAAAWLHDTLEDTETTLEELKQEFGDDIAGLVLEVTHEGEADNHGYYFPHLHSKRGIMLKFADRLSNMSRMESWSEARQIHYLKRSKFWKDE